MINAYNQIVDFDAVRNNHFINMSAMGDVKGIPKRATYLMNRLKDIAFSKKLDLTSTKIRFATNSSTPNDLMKDFIIIESLLTGNNQFFIYPRGPKCGVYTIESNGESVSKDQHGRDNWTAIHKFFMGDAE